jgi:hypothetical protein
MSKDSSSRVTPSSSRVTPRPRSKYHILKLLTTWDVPPTLAETVFASYYLLSWKSKYFLKQVSGSGPGPAPETTSQPGPQPTLWLTRRGVTYRVLWAGPESLENSENVWLSFRVPMAGQPFYPVVLVRARRAGGNL